MTPVWTQMLDELGLRLQNISVVNGYFTDIHVLERSRANPFKTDDLPAMTYWKAADRLTNRRLSQTQRELRVGVEFYSKSNDGDLDTFSDQFFSDLFIALYRNPANPLVTDNPDPMFKDKKFVVGLNQLQPIISEGSKPRFGVVAIITFTYWISNLDPFNLL